MIQILLTFWHILLLWFILIFILIKLNRKIKWRNNNSFKIMPQCSRIYLKKCSSECTKDLNCNNFSAKPIIYRLCTIGFICHNWTFKVILMWTLWRTLKSLFKEIFFYNTEEKDNRTLDWLKYQRVRIEFSGNRLIVKIPRDPFE